MKTYTIVLKVNLHSFIAPLAFSIQFLFSVTSNLGCGILVLICKNKNSNTVMHSNKHVLEEIHPQTLSLPPKSAKVFWLLSLLRSL